MTTIKSKINQIYQIKQQIKEALIAKGYTEEQVGNSFATYPSLIRNISGGDTPEPIKRVTDALMLHNGKYLKLRNRNYLKLH